MIKRKIKTFFGIGNCQRCQSVHQLKTNELMNYNGDVVRYWMELCELSVSFKAKAVAIKEKGAPGFETEAIEHAAIARGIDIAMSAFMCRNVGECLGEFCGENKITIIGKK